MSGEIAIRLSDVSKKYNLYNRKIDRLKESLHPLKKQYHRDFYAVKNINIEIKKGEILGIVGKNGSGKSTLLKLISGVLTPTQGIIEVNGTIVALLELGSGFNPEYTGIENIYFYSAIMGYTKAQIDKVVEEIISFAELEEFINQPLKTYSSGMKARLAFSVSVNVNPDILILDEVLSVGDELFRRKCYARMQEFFKGGKTILFVSHSAQAINEICTRAILLNRGKQILDGHPKMVTTNYQKYLFAPREQEVQIIHEIETLNNNSKLKNEIKNELNNYIGKTSRLNNDGSGVNATMVNESEVNNIVKKEVESIVGSKPHFINNFESKNIVMYKNFDVDIYDVEILTEQDEKVNILVYNDWYNLTYKVKFNIEVKNISFAMAILHKRGILITNSGGREHRITSVVNAKPGDEFFVKWKFRNMLRPDTYFANVQVSGDIDGQNEILSTIHDAIVFKLHDIPNINFGGIMYMDQTIHFEKLVR